jgi:FAD/FMN-containing dehydrogenase
MYLGAGARAGAAAELIARARLICGEAHVITNPVVLETYRSDGLRRDLPSPPVVVLPATASEVVGLLGACAALSVAFTVRGAGTSTHGGALPQLASAMLVLTRMRRILRPINGDGEITVEPGVSVAMLRSACHARLLPDASTSGTVGGHLASVRGLRGVTGIEIVEPDGNLAHSDARRPGFDFAGAFCGSRGLAGIAVSISLRVAEL